MQVRCFSTTSTLLKSITPHKTTGVLYSDLERLALTLPADLFQVLFGCLLGDLCAYKKPNGSTQLKFEQSTVHSSYLLHLFSILYDYCGAFPRIMERYDARYQRHSYSLWFYTLSLPCFDSLYSLFYVNGSKQIPADIANYITPISLSYWIADDGAKHGKGLMLNTNSYEKVQVELLSFVLNQTFGFSSSVYAKKGRTTTYYTIYIPSKDMPKLRALVLPYLHSSMHSKITQ